MSQLVLANDVQIRGKMSIPNTMLREMNLNADAGDAFVKKLSEHFGQPMTVVHDWHPEGLIFQWYPSADDQTPPKKERRPRAETRAARALMREKGIKYTEALRMVQKAETNS